MKAAPPMNTFEFFHSQSMEIRALKNQKCSQMALFSYENLFFENYHIGGHLLGFQTKWIMTTQGTYYSTVIMFPMVLASSLDFHWPYCEGVLKLDFFLKIHQSWCLYRSNQQSFKSFEDQLSLLLLVLKSSGSFKNTYFS